MAGLGERDFPFAGPFDFGDALEVAFAAVLALGFAAAAFGFAGALAAAFFGLAAGLALPLS
ncbi:MAG: hypothetical protein R3265_10235, partial [Hyphomonas sp.]|nr:hypothetical protein [Hyphomonas sp.]